MKDQVPGSLSALFLLQSCCSADCVSRVDNSCILFKCCGSEQSPAESCCKVALVRCWEITHAVPPVRFPLACSLHFGRTHARISPPCPAANQINTKVPKQNKMCCDAPIRTAPPVSLACITGTLRWAGRGWRSRVSGANAFMLLIQLLSGVIPACQFVWAADLHNEFILANVLHTHSLLLSLLSLSLFSSSLSCTHSVAITPLFSRPPCLPLLTPHHHRHHPPLIKFTKCPESRVFKCKRASFPNWRHSPSMPCTQQAEPRWEAPARDGWMEMMMEERKWAVDMEGERVWEGERG